MKKIAIITCYFGKLPEWMQLWLNSCEINRTIDFYLITDSDLSGYSIGGNVHCMKETLEGLRKRISEALGKKCVLNHPYKLCDYKPFYGLIYGDLISGHDFWGHCDLDMVFGNLRKHITDEILQKYDRIFEVGHLSLYRNTDRINHLYLLPGAMFDWKEMVRNKHCTGYDEHTGITRICEVNHIPAYKDVVCADIDPHYRMFHMMDEDTIAGSMKLKNYEHQIFCWSEDGTFQYYLDGRNRVRRQEVSYIHFMRKFPACADKCQNSKKYCITHKSFLPITGEITAQFILENDYSVHGMKKKMEYAAYFIGNGIRAFRSGQLLLRVRLRLNRVKGINKRAVNRKVS